MAHLVTSSATRGEQGSDARIRFFVVKAYCVNKSLVAEKVEQHTG